MNKDYERLHELCSRMKRFRYGDKIPHITGIDIAFEENETSHGVNRIVRIGESGYLPKRIDQHFSDSFGGSVFKKWVWGAVIRKSMGNASVEKWEDIKNILIRNSALKNECISYMREKISFVLFDYTSSTDGIIKPKSNLINIVSADTCCTPSDNWLGIYSCKEEIMESGLWQIKYVIQCGSCVPAISEEDWVFLEKAACR